MSTEPVLEPPPHLVEAARRLEMILRRRDPKHAWIVEVRQPDPQDPSRPARDEIRESESGAR